MRYKLLIGAFVLLIATPAFSQEFSPIIVETGKPTPSIVKSGESFKITYRAKFFDTVLIYEDQMQPENLVLNKIEVIGLEIDKNPFDRPESETLGFVNVWDFTYTFRIIQPQKGMYKISSFNFIWVEKKAGITIEKAKENEKPKEFPTEEVGIGYISSIIKPPPLDIRDEINFVLPIAGGVVLRRWAYGVIGVASLFFVIIVFRFAKYSKTLKSQEAIAEEAGAETMDGHFFIHAEPVLSPKRARKKFLRELDKLRGEIRLSFMDLEKKLRHLVRALILVELRGVVKDSMSENEIYVKLITLDAKQRKQVGSKFEYVVDFARRLRAYQEDIDSGNCSLDTGDLEEIDDLESRVKNLNLRNRVLSFLKSLFRKER